MTDRARIRVAAGVTALFLAGISVAGVAVHHAQPQAAPTSQPAVVASAPGATTGTSASGNHESYKATGYAEIDNDE